MTITVFENLLSSKIMKVMALVVRIVTVEEKYIQIQVPRTGKY